MRQKKKIDELNQILAQVKAYKDEMRDLSNKELKHKTKEFKGRLAAGETLDMLLPEAFAVMCEADFRVLEKFPYDAQILGGIALHQGYLAEMNTGEGKTLVATLPLYLNALTGKSTILVTTNEYLAIRDAEEMGQVYSFMGLSCVAGVKEKEEEQFTNEEKKAIYASDIVYTTHSIMGFDYLLNNLVTSAEDRFMRDFYYVIIDEADSVLLDAAQTPLVISGSPRVQSNLYQMADFFVSTLKENEDYELEDKKVWLTGTGVKRAEHFFQIDNFYGKEFFEINRHVTLALRAHALFAPEKEYMVSSEGELLLLDSDSGRVMPGVKLRGGQHQALEQKEGLEVTKENRSIASITYQNLFLLFPKMSGMSGTISDASDEIYEVYKTKVLVMPPNRPVARIDHPDLFFAEASDQYAEAISEAIKTHETGQPVLIVVSTIAATELVSKTLVMENIPHNVLNANNAFWEAQIIKEAGQMNAVTVATSMAGRGTDIKLGEGVKELGGLAVIGIGRMANVRQERQARGRAGRQGDPGLSKFYVSLEDEIVKQNGKTESKFWRKPYSKERLGKIINRSQDLAEELAIESRKRAMDYDVVMQKQRKLVYATRNELLDGGSLSMEKVVELVSQNVEEFLASPECQDMASVKRYMLDHISYRLDEHISEVTFDKEILKPFLMKEVDEGLKRQKKKLKSKKNMNQFLRMATLSAVDDAWVEQVDYLQQLQHAVSGRASAQRNLVYEYQKDALEAFEDMAKSIRINIMRNILLSNVYMNSEGEIQILLP